MTFSVSSGLEVPVWVWRSSLEEAQAFQAGPAPLLTKAFLQMRAPPLHIHLRWTLQCRRKPPVLSLKHA